MDCLLPLVNLGAGCRLVMDEMKRIGFVSTSKGTSKNNITKVLAATLAGWQGLMDKPNFEDDVLEKVVFTPTLYGVTDEEAEAVEFDEEGYFEKLADGDVTILAKMNSHEAARIKRMSDMEDRAVSIYLFDAVSKVWAKEADLDIEPMEIQNMSVQKFKLKTREKISQVIVRMRLKNPADMNLLTSVQITDGEIADDEDFYSLTDGTGVTTVPAVTGAEIALTEDDSGGAITGSVFGEWTFVDILGVEPPITLAAAGSLSELTPGNYIINEPLLLTSGETYRVENRKLKYDLTIGQIVVP